LRGEKQRVRDRFVQPAGHSADLLDKLAAAKGLAVKVTPPFDRQRGAEDSDLPPEFSQRAMSLTEQQPVSVTSDR